MASSHGRHPSSQGDMGCRLDQTEVTGQDMEVSKQASVLLKEARLQGHSVPSNLFKWVFWNT